MQKTTQNVPYGSDIAKARTVQSAIQVNILLSYHKFCYITI